MLLNWDTCGDPNVALLAFWEQSGLEQTSSASELRDLISWLQSDDPELKQYAA
jgi:hypothetical protein